MELRCKLASTMSWTRGDDGGETAEELQVQTEVGVRLSGCLFWCTRVPTAKSPQGLQHEEMEASSIRLSLMPLQQ